MKILVVSSYLPYPLLSGGNIRLFNLLKNISKNNQITLICEKRANQSDKDVNALMQFCEKVITVNRKKQWSPANILKTGFSTSPFLIIGHKSLEMTAKIREELEKEMYDLIHVETSYVMQNLPKVSIPVVLTEHNVEYLVYQRYAKNSSVFLRPVLYVDVLKLKRIEQYFWKKADKLIAVSQTEKRLMKREDTAVVPNGVDLLKFKYQNVEEKFAEKEKKLLFIGDFKWIQN
jgi:glycosyltransferase involved in cell wall biosynthesis